MFSFVGKRDPGCTMATRVHDSCIGVCCCCHLACGISDLGHFMRGFQAPQAERASLGGCELCLQIFFQCEFDDGKSIAAVRGWPDGSLEVSLLNSQRISRSFQSIIDVFPPMSAVRGHNHAVLRISPSTCHHLPCPVSRREG